jgi:subtilisin family serine protease
MRLAELPSPWRYLVLALVVLGVFALLHWVDRKDGPATTIATTFGATVRVHVKGRPGLTVLSIDGAAAHPLFTHLQPSVAAYDDPRVRWFYVDVPAHDLDAVLAVLADDRNVEQAFVPPEVTLPQPIAPLADDACPITTPSFESYQGYLGAAPGGIDAPAAWRRGVRGAGVWFADIEGGWNSAHEDLPGDRITHAGGQMYDDPSWRAHGTAVLGEVVGRDNGKGVVGIAPDVERVFTSSIGGVAVADAIDTAASKLRAGDVLLIELQGGGPRGRYLPMEFWDDNYDAIEAATRRGVIVIEAAGNGGENLDHKAYKGKLERGKRDSGAILVGAGGPPRDGYTDRARLEFSNYGSRVDVQGWGRMVATLDYGDLQRCAGADRHYTGLFSGTSSASPIVAGAAVLVESYARRAGGSPLPPRDVRELLRRTGTPQEDGVGGRDAAPVQSIGPRPDLARALVELARRTAPRGCTL